MTKRIGVLSGAVVLALVSGCSFREWEPLNHSSAGSPEETFGSAGRKQASTPEGSSGGNGGGTHQYLSSGQGAAAQIGEGGRSSGVDSPQNGGSSAMASGRDGEGGVNSQRSSGETPGSGGALGLGGSVGDSSATKPASRGGASGTVPATTRPVGTGGTASTDTSAPYVDPDPESCTDSSTFAETLTQQFQKVPNVATNVPGKTYGIYTNWWGKFDRQALTVSGLGFTVEDPNNVSVGNSISPAGFPQILIGQYSTFKTSGSNLPMLVSSIKSVPVVIKTNICPDVDADAAVDAWFNLTDAPLATTATEPTGGALMVWLRKPSNHQPMGTLRGSNTVVSGVDGTWNVWVDGKYVTYVNVDGVSELTFDLNKFIQHAVAESLVVSDKWYLNTIFAGFEIWSGGNGLKLEQFCAKVN